MRRIAHICFAFYLVFHGHCYLLPGNNDQKHEAKGSGFSFGQTAQRFPALNARNTDFENKTEYSARENISSEPENNSLDASVEFNPTEKEYQEKLIVDASAEQNLDGDEEYQLSTREKGKPEHQNVGHPYSSSESAMGYPSGVPYPAPPPGYAPSSPGKPGSTHSPGHHNPYVHQTPSQYPNRFQRRITGITKFFNKGYHTMNRHPPFHPNGEPNFRHIEHLYHRGKSFIFKHGRKWKQSMNPGYQHQPSIHDHGHKPSGTGDPYGYDHHQSSTPPSPSSPKRKRKSESK